MLELSKLFIAHIFYMNVAWCGLHSPFQARLLVDNSLLLLPALGSGGSGLRGGAEDPTFKPDDM